MKSDAGSEPLDLGCLVTTDEDVRALRRARERDRVPAERFLRVLATLPPPSYDALRRRKGPSGPEPFRL